MRPGNVPLAVGIFALSYLLRLFYLLQIAETPFFDFLQLDPLYYHQWAVSIADGDWLGSEVFEQSPLYPYLLAGYFLIAGQDLWILRLIQIGLGSITCVLTFFLGTRLFDRRAGTIAGIGCAVYGPFFFYEGQVMKEFLTPLLTTAALLLVLRGAGSEEDPAPRPAALAGAGILIGLAGLVRDNSLLLLPALGLWLLWARRWRLAGPAALLAGAAVVLIPVGIRNLAVAGDPVLTTSGGGEVFYIGNGPYANGAYVPPPWVRSNPRFEHEDFRKKAREMTGRDLSRGESSRFWWKQGLAWIAENPSSAAALWLRKLALFWNDHELPDNYSYDSFARFSPMLDSLLTFGPVASFALAGLILSARRWRSLLPLAIAGLTYMVSVLLFFNFARFRLPVVPLLLVLAAAGITGLWEGFRSLRRSREGRARTLAAASAVIASFAFVTIDWSSRAEEPFQDRLHLGAAYRQAGRLDEAESTLREVIAQAERIVREHGGDPTRAPGIPGGITFTLALSAAHRDLAGVLSDGGRHEEAARAYERAFALSPGDATLPLARCAALREAGSLDEAEAACRAALRLDPSSFAIRFDLSTVLYQSGRGAEALEVLSAAETSSLADLDRADYHYGMGIILLSIGGREAEAIEHMRQGLRLSPEGPQADQAREYLRERS